VKSGAAKTIGLRAIRDTTIRVFLNIVPPKITNLEVLSSTLMPTGVAFDSLLRGFGRLRVDTFLRSDQKIDRTLRALSLILIMPVPLGQWE
jgi:hypothetical protein